MSLCCRVYFDATVVRVFVADFQKLWAWTLGGLRRPCLQTHEVGVGSEPWGDKPRNSFDLEWRLDGAELLSFGQQRSLQRCLAGVIQLSAGTRAGPGNALADRSAIARSTAELCKL